MDEEIELRQAVAADAAAVRMLTRQAYAKWVPLIGREPKPMRADYVEALRAHRIDLAYLAGDLAALIETINQPDHLLVENLAVAPSFQKKGLGSRLMAHAEQLALELGHAKVRLYTNKRFAENIELYRRLGYAIEREEELPVGIAVHMSKSIT